MILTFNKIHEENTLTFDDEEYVRDAENPYVFVSINPITIIGSRAFYECESLTHIVIPNTVTSIGKNAFRFCKSLTTIIIPDSVTTIDILKLVQFSASYPCRSLDPLDIPPFVYYGVFNNCPSLTTIETNDKDAYIINYCKEYYPNINIIVISDNSYVLK